jgi:uncharacterized protein YggE
MNSSFFAAPYNRILGTAALVGLVAALFAYAYYTARQAEYLYMGPTTISITGEGEVLAIPDIAQFSFTVTATGTMAQDAQTVVKNQEGEILKYLREQGVEDRFIKTEQYALYPKYRWEQPVCLPGMPCPAGEQLPDGFEVTQTIAVKVKDTARAGELMTGVGERGATNISGLTFTVEDDLALKAEARAKAIAHAKGQSEALARELGVRIIRMTGYFEEAMGSGYPMPYGAPAMDMMAREAAPELPPGELATKSRVTITYQVEE